MLRVFADVDLTVNLAKSEFGHAEVSFLGHVRSWYWLGQATWRQDSVHS